jgi:hypothetical protein
MDTDEDLMGDRVDAIVIEQQWWTHPSLRSGEGVWPAGALYHPDGQRNTPPFLSAFICVHPVKRTLLFSQ